MYDESILYGPLSNNPKIRNAQIRAMSEIVDKATPQLSPLLRKTYEELFFLQKKEVDIADEEGVGSSAVTNRKNRLLKSMRDILIALGFIVPSKAELKAEKAAAEERNQRIDTEYYDGRYVIEPTEAETVRRIYREYLSGKGTTAIANGLNADGVPTRLGGIWHKSAVMKILKNYTYTGNLLLQKTYREDYISKETVPNNGEMPMYHATDTHEAIIDLDVFDAVQAEIERRSKKYTSTKRNYAARYPFSGMIVCGNCGKHYRRKTTAGGIVWICTTFNTQGKAACPSKQIPEEKLYEMTADIDLGDVDCIIAENGNVIRIRMKDGSEITRHWTDRSRAESWTDEMKEQARQKQLERSKRNG